MTRLLLTALTLAVVLGLILGLTARFAVNSYYGSGPLAHETTIVIEQGSSARVIAATLKANHVIYNKTVFLAEAVLTGKYSKLQVGEYSFPAGCSVRRALSKIAEGQVVQHAFTMPEGWTVKQVLTALLAAPRLKGDIQHLPPEGMLLPDTYYYRYGDTRADILRRMQRAMDETLQKLWTKRDPQAPYPNSQSALVLASIVEKESGIAAERPRIAGVFLNRLAIGMPLQADPTIIYGLSSGSGVLGRTLTHEDIAIKSAYNSYINKGLPPTPIANPGRAAIEAVLHPETHKFLYFVATGNGGHNFAETFDMHAQNINSWLRVKKAKANSVH